MGFFESSGRFVFGFPLRRLPPKHGFLFLNPSKWSCLTMFEFVNHRSTGKQVLTQLSSSSHGSSRESGLRLSEIFWLDDERCPQVSWPPRASEIGAKEMVRHQPSLT